jgi:heterotetrameric sarcosine oxidase gamma subunit
MSERHRFEAPGLVLTRAPAPGLVMLRLRAGDAQARAVAAAILDTGLPAGPAHPVLGAPQDLFWTAADLVDRLRVGLAGHHAACHAIGDARARFDVTGAASRGLLVKGTGIDLDARVFAPGTAALTRFALLSVLLVCRDAAPSFSIFADRPIAAYLWDWLVDAARGGMP